METNLQELRAVQRMNRAERKAMADSRAMEEQMERQNPLSGRGATPSMGLSQVRGGKKMMMDAGAQGKHLMEHLESLHGSGYAEAFHKGMRGAGFLSDLGIPLVSDVAGMFGLGKKNRKKHNDSDSDSDEEMNGGLHTGRYEGEGTGGMFSKDTQDFSGHMKGGFYGMLASVGIPLLMNLLGKGKMTQDAHDQVKEMIEDKMEEHMKKHHMKGGFGLYPALSLASVGLPILMKMLGKGKITQDAHDKLKKMFMKCDKMEGSGRVVGGMRKNPIDNPLYMGNDMSGMGTGGMMQMDRMNPIMNANPMRLHSPAHPRMEMQGMGKVKRVVGAGDGRRKRADIVKKVMADKGLSMIQASKYVKENAMYP
jgi:hypothetical protein